jgi:glycosyltransferase involved in cell wall biosynthesis
MRVAFLIPCLNEEEALPLVLAEIPSGMRVVLCDNGSTDRSAALAREAGADVVAWPSRGYGGAVLAGLKHLSTDPPQIVVVLDADHSFDLGDLPALLGPIERGEADFVLGERLTRGGPNALTPQQVWGNRLACRLMQLQTGHRYLDMGPFRAIRYESLVSLNMADLTWGWNVEMQMKAVRAGLRVLEVPVACRQRVGVSKISGTLSGVVRAGAKIVYACWKYRK